MIYLHTWFIGYGDPLVDGWAKVFPTKKMVQPTFFKGEQRVLVCTTDRIVIASDPKSSHKDRKQAHAIFWMAGTYNLTPAEFMAKELACSTAGPYTPIFDGTAVFKDGKVIFKGRAVPPFTDICEAIFMLNDEQLDANNVLVNKAYPVVIETTE